MVRRVAAALAIVCASVGAVQAQVKLEYKVPEGVTYRQKAASKTHQVLTIAGNDVVTDADEEGVATSAAGRRRADGTLPVEITIRSVKTRLSIAGMEFTIDSADKDPKVDLPQLAFLADVIKALRGSSFTLVLDAGNALKSVEGTEKNLAKAGELSPQAAAALKSRFDVDRIRRQHDQMRQVLPEGLVREGEPWDRTEATEIGGGQTLTFKKRYEYKGTAEQGGRTLDRIDVKATEVAYAMDPNVDSPAKVTKSDLKVESSAGSILFDRESGTVVERKEKTRMKGTMAMTVAGMDLDVALDLTLDTTATAEKVGK